jgi:hypothetical protein
MHVHEHTQWDKTGSEVGIVTVYTAVTKYTMSDYHIHKYKALLWQLPWLWRFPKGIVVCYLPTPIDPAGTTWRPGCTKCSSCWWRCCENMWLWAGQEYVQIWQLPEEDCCKCLCMSNNELSDFINLFLSIPKIVAWNIVCLFGIYKYGDDSLKICLFGKSEVV